MFCDTLEPCCTAAQFTFDRSACEQYIGGDLQNQVTLAGHGAAFDCDSGQRCLDEIARAISACNAFDKAQLPDCNHLLIGTLPVGAPCTSWMQCAAPVDVYADCRFAAGDTGTCALLPSSPRGQVGDACGASCNPYGQCTSGTSDQPDVACYQSDGLYCGHGQCATIGVVGSPCWSQTGCPAGALCLNSSGGFQSSAADAPGQCVVPQSNGQLATPSSCVGKPEPKQD